MGHNGTFDDFEATNPNNTGSGTGSSGTGSTGGGSTSTTSSVFTDDFNRANSNPGYGTTDWTLHTPYSGGTVTTAQLSGNKAVVAASYTMSVHDSPADSDTHYAQAVVDVDASNNWVGPAVRLNSTGSQGYAVMARGGANELRLYWINNGVQLKVAIGAGTTVDGKTVKVETDGTTVKVYLDGVLKITHSTTDFVGASNRFTGMLGHNGAFDDFEATSTTTTTTPPPPPSTTQTQVHHSFNGHPVGSTIDGEFVLSVSDHLGSGGTSRTEAGVTTSQSYTPFGYIRQGGGNTLATDMTFTGQTDDPGTGLIDYNARAYDPQLGRFVMADTVLAGLNRYSYVDNNPLNATDPTGHEPCVGGMVNGTKCSDAARESAEAGVNNPTFASTTSSNQSASELAQEEQQNRSGHLAAGHAAFGDLIPTSASYHFGAGSGSPVIQPTDVVVVDDGAGGLIITTVQAIALDTGLSVGEVLENLVDSNTYVRSNGVTAYYPKSGRPEP